MAPCHDAFDDTRQLYSSSSPSVFRPRHRLTSALRRLTNCHLEWWRVGHSLICVFVVLVLKKQFEFEMNFYELEAGLSFTRIKLSSIVKDQGLVLG